MNQSAMKTTLSRVLSFGERPALPALGGPPSTAAPLPAAHSSVLCHNLTATFSMGLSKDAKLDQARQHRHVSDSSVPEVQLLQFH
jgi:hypothetical protein